MQNRNISKKYRVVMSKDAILDIKRYKTYIIENFKYKGYAENFSKRIKLSIKSLEVFPEGYEKTGYIIEGLEVLSRCY